MDLYFKNRASPIETEPMCASLIKLDRHINYDKRISPIDILGQRSKVKVTMDLHGNNLVNTVEAEPLCASSLNFADILTMVRG